MSQHHCWLLFLSLTTLWSLQSHSHQVLTPDTCPGWQLPPGFYAHTPATATTLKHSSAHFCLKCLCTQFEGESIHSIWVEVLGAGPHVSSPSFLWLQNRYQPAAGSHVCRQDAFPTPLLHGHCLNSSLAVIAWIMTKASYFVFETALAVLELYVI